MESDQEQLNLTVIADDPITSKTTTTLSQSQFFSLIEQSRTIHPIVQFFYANANNNGGKKLRKEAHSIVSSRLNKAKTRRLFGALLVLLSRTVEEGAYTTVLPRDDDDDDGPQDEIHDDTMMTTNERDDNDGILEAKAALQFLQFTADLLHSHISNLQSSTIDEIFEMAVLLHDSLFSLHEICTSTTTTAVQPSLQKHAISATTSIITLCEQWWHSNLDDKEQLVTQLIPLLLLASLDHTHNATTTQRDIKRLYSMRHAFDLLDFHDPSITSLKTQLLRTASHPLFFKCKEGKRFLSHLFTLPELCASMHEAVRVQILCKKSVLGVYADVYWGAFKSLMVKSNSSSSGGGGGEEDWNDNDPLVEARKAFEENALQDLAYMSIHAANPTTAKNCRLVLDKFLLYKKDPEVESLLYRIYGPILWRSVIAANAKVRMQAAVVLGDTFPLRDSVVSTTGNHGIIKNASFSSVGKAKVGYETVVVKTVEAIVKLMRDEVPSVRVQGCICAGKVLGGFWVAIPSSDKRVLLNEIIAKHASDITSAAVRTTAIQTITSLLAEEKTHAVLRPLLPSLGNVIHDKTEKVRLAVVQMLLTVKKLKGMKYYHVVPAKHLLARLADEGRGKNNPTGPVARGLTELLSNSFFPTGSKKTMADVISRTFRLLQDDPAAALVFYRNASTQLSVHSIVKLISALMKCLCFLIVEEKKGMSEDVSGLDLSTVVEEGGLDSDDGEVVGDSSTMVIIAESISVLWESIENDLKNADESVNELLLRAFSGNIITEVFCHFETKCGSSPHESEKWAECFRALVAILNCAGKMDADSIDSLRTHVVSELEKSWDLPVEKRARTNFSPYASLLCTWDMADEVAACLASSISNYFEGGDQQPKKKKVRGKKAAGSLPVLHIDVALNILGHILQGTYPSLIAARESILNCESGCDAIISALKKAQDATVGILQPVGTSRLELNDALVRNLGRCVECHGKLLVHKALQHEVSTTLSTEAMSLVSWISETVVPSLNKLTRQDHTLRDLDLSGISGIDSPINSPIEGTKRNSSRNSSFPRMSLGLSDGAAERGSFNVYQDQSKFLCSVEAAVTLMRSVMLMIVSWFTVCRNSESSVTNHVVNWCQVLRNSDEIVRKSLLPLFCRIALLFLENGSQSILLNEVLAYVDNSELNEMEEQTLASFTCRGLVCMNDDTASKAGIASVVKIICSSNQKYDLERDGSDEPLPILERISPGIKAIIVSLMKDNRGSLMLAQFLANDNNTNPIKADLFDEISKHGPRTGALNKIVKEWSGDRVILENSIDNDDTSINDCEEPIAEVNSTQAASEVVA